MKNVARWFTAVVLVAGSLASLSHNIPAVAQSVHLEGSWRGAGIVVMPSGDTERATCRARFVLKAEHIYAVDAVCSTPSFKIAQSANIRRVSDGHYAGQFYNEEYKVSGDIRVSVRASQLQASATGGGGTAQFILSR